MMTRLALVAPLALVAASANSQYDLRSTTGSAAESYINGIRGGSVGYNYSIDAINNGVLQQARAYGASNGITSTYTANSSLNTGPQSRIPAASFGSSFSPAQKPFANATSGSTVSPYLSLFNTGIGGGFQTIDNYNVLVRPQLEQQRVNQSLQRQQQQLNQRIQQISAQPELNPRGSEQIIATGHQTGFRYYSHYYPTIGNAQNRRR